MTKKYKILMCFLSYRIPSRVTTARQYQDGTLYAECPRCGVVIEKDYQPFCGGCGQRLNWRYYNDEVIVKVCYPH